VTTLNFHQAARFATSSDVYVGSGSDVFLCCFLAIVSNEGKIAANFDSARRTE
jgi:hypothetical protein